MGKAKAPNAALGTIHPVDRGGRSRISSPSHWAKELIKLLPALATAAVPVSSTRAAEIVQVQNFGANPGNLLMFKYIPDSLPRGAPLVVALHGCTQNARQFGTEGGWREVADQLQFVLLLPEQQAANNDALCFNFFSTDHNRRGQGEAASIAQMVDGMKAEHGTGADRTFIMGLSAGGGMAAAMLAAYPDVFRAGAIIAGLPYGCASAGNNLALNWQKYWTVLWYGEAVWASWRCGIDRTHTLRTPPASRSPEEWRDLLKEADGPRPAVRPKVSLWQGDDDDTVHPQNLNELVEQWTAAHGIDQVSDGEDAADTHRHRVYKDAAGVTQVEVFQFPTLGHALPTNPGTGAGHCGRSDPGHHYVDRHICAASAIASFWGLTP
ncbi:extracellular catalytic domain type 1 short-chain-length polyhydroxyalkanoate depolymerase [Methylobacterium oxalidis]|uniref:extracellular catalytic domain type 1 short-chain-length polyhydroxyalkanoate depolymerase n=1 Tax=Methylobacterium oxalidis TaxID=944322 RepID=UPI0033150C8A